MKHLRAREVADSRSLNPQAIRKVVRSLFRRRNDHSVVNLDKLPAELQRFGVLTVKDLRLLMEKHRRSLLDEENIRMSRSETLWLRQEGFGSIDILAQKSWFSVAGLVRTAMEIEFGEEAAVYVTDTEV